MIFAVPLTMRLLDSRPGPRAIQGLFQQLSGIGIGGIDLEYRNPSECPKWPDIARRVCAAARELGFGLSVHGPNVDISATDRAVRELALAAHREVLQHIARASSGVVYVLHPESVKPVRRLGDGEARREMCRQSLAELVPLAREGGLRMALENMRWRADNPNRTGMYTDELMEIIDGLDEQVLGICFDIGHAYISEGADCYDAFRRNARRIIHVHLDDNHGIEDEHLEPGQGDIDLPRFYRVAKLCNYAGMVQLEVEVPENGDELGFFRRNYERYLQMASVEPAA